ncbi:MAG TPA: hypothetical protein DCQ83_00185 [Fibrobacteres bacterium]|jgi:hypothetical protein|nr:hypothetical protein [Fibrobacterota bacterium]
MSERMDAGNLDETLARLDQLIENTQDVERIRSGLGMRLALSMARELQAGKPLGSETSALVAGWTERFGKDTVEIAVGVARQFLTRNEELLKDFGTRLGIKNPGDGNAS